MITHNSLITSGNEDREFFQHIVLITLIISSYFFPLFKMLKGLGSPKKISLGRELRKATPASGPRKPWGVLLEGLREKGESSTVVKELTWLLHTGSTKKASKMCL